jgi:hypothetical protein
MRRNREALPEAACECAVRHHGFAPIHDLIPPKPAQCA